MERKTFLKKSLGLAGISAVLIDACSKDVTDTTSTDTTGTSTGDCIVAPTEEEGPFPYASGEINNPLNRSDVTGGQTGVPLTLTFQIVNANDNCNAAENVRVDIWHCNKDGYYSGYANQPGVSGTQSYVGETWLRGYQLSDANGAVTFKTIYPGWYSGRATHVHLELYIDNTLKKITQVAFPETISDAVHTSTLYAAHGVNPTRNASDHVFGNSATDLANETLTVTGDISGGYTASITIGLSL